MNKIKRFAVGILISVCTAMIFTACSSDDDDDVVVDVIVVPEAGYSWEEAGNTLTIAAEADQVAGVWSIGDRQLYINPYEGYYVYATPEGRVGRGDYDDSNGSPAIIFNDMYYNLAIREDGVLVPIADGESDDESIDRITFFPDAAESIEVWDISYFDGYWANDAGEYIYIDSASMMYAVESDSTSGGGLIADDGNGKGMFLSLNGYAYICPLDDMSGFTLIFEAGTFSGPDGSFEGTFYANSGNDLDF